ncbi:methyltransferase-domain-containing protein [Mucor lusitanicus]|nr:methyltransferase-domain-containing protein [Mucor lusitanicus]
MQPFFETSGWALPKSIAPQKQQESAKKTKSAVQQAEDNSKEVKASREADQIQAQMATLNDTSPKEPKAKKPRNRNKKRALEQKPEEKEPVQNKKAKTAPANDQKKKLQQLLNKKNKQQPAKNEKKQQTQETSQPKQSNTTQKNSPAAAPVDDGLTPLQRKMKEKLSGARFRWLNEQLYTTPGKHSFSLFQEKPELFDEYHEGFRHQVESWPVNPVDVIISQLKKLPKDTVIADLGCGDAMIAQSLTKQKVLSFDLIAKNDLVTACDITKLPLEANSVDVAVFSLSLMGTNYLDFLKEAHRVLKVGGELKIAEVVSRFSDLDSFISLLEGLGFDFMDKEDDNKMFVMLYFTKQPNYEEEIDNEMLAGLSKTQIRSLKKGAGINNSKTKLQKKAQQLLKPCLYKKR